MRVVSTSTHLDSRSRRCIQGHELASSRAHQLLQRRIADEAHGSSDDATQALRQLVRHAFALRIGRRGATGSSLRGTLHATQCGAERRVWPAPHERPRRGGPHLRVRGPTRGRAAVQGPSRPLRARGRHGRDWRRDPLCAVAHLAPKGLRRARRACGANRCSRTASACAACDTQLSAAPLPPVPLALRACWWGTQA